MEEKAAARSEGRAWGCQRNMSTSNASLSLGVIEITTLLHYISHCKISSGTNWWKRWTYGVFNTEWMDLASIYWK